MRLLFVTPYLPSPPTFGGQRRIHGLMMALRRRHELGLLSLHNPLNPLDEWRERTRAAFPGAEVFVQPVFGLQGAAKRLAQLRSLVQTDSFDSSSHRSAALSARLRERLAAERWDAVVVEFAQMMVNLEGLRAAPVVVLDEHNVEYDLQKRTTRNAGSAIRRIYQEINWRKLRREEVAAWRRADAVSVTSDRDLSLVRADAPEARAVLAPNGVDLEEFAPPGTPTESDTVVFFGAHNYFPNADGLRFLLLQIWPLVTAARPSARLRIVGPPPTADIIALAPAGVRFEGFVKDVVAAVGRAAVAIAPLRIGGGTRLKVLEAMALARPVVATRIGAEGIDLVDGRDVVLADSPADFAAALVRLLGAPAEAAALGARGRRRVEEAYSWNASAARLETLLAELVARKGP